EGPGPHRGLPREAAALMGVELAAWPDVHDVLFALFQDLADTVAGPRRPPNYQDQMPLVRVRRLGGADDRITDVARVDVEVYASTLPLRSSDPGAPRRWPAPRRRVAYRAPARERRPQWPAPGSAGKRGTGRRKDGASGSPVTTGGRSLPHPARAGSPGAGSGHLGIHGGLFQQPFAEQREPAVLARALGIHQ